MRVRHFPFKSICWLPAAMALAGSLTGCHGQPETVYSPPGASFSNLSGRSTLTNAPAVKIIMPADGAVFHAHADIRLRVLATPYGSALEPTRTASKALPGDRWEFVGSPENVYTIEFLAGTNSLGTQGASEVSARVRQEPGKATPFIMPVVGFPSVDQVWHDAPAGHYTLTARVVNQSGGTTISAPVTITVQP